jgi:hypothetical protein
MALHPISQRTLAILEQIRDNTGGGGGGGTVELGEDTIAALQQAFDDANNVIESNLESVANLLSDILAEIMLKIEAGEDVGLTDEAVTALATAIATLFNYPVDYPDAAALSSLQTIETQLDELQRVGGTATVTMFTSTTSATIKAANSARKRLTLDNGTNVILYVLEGSGTAAVTTRSYALLPGEIAFVDDYTGQVNGILAATPTGQVNVTEIT